MLQNICRRLDCTRKRRRFFDEAATGTEFTDPNENISLDVYLPIIDRLNQEMSAIFNERNSAVYRELWCLNPNNDGRIITRDSTFSLACLAALATVDELRLKEELIQFATIYQFSQPEQNESHQLEEEVETNDENCEAAMQHTEQKDVNPSFCKGNCSHCLGCVLALLVSYRYHCSSFNILYRCLRIALTLDLYCCFM